LEEYPGSSLRPAAELLLAMSYQKVGDCPMALRHTEAVLKSGSPIRDIAVATLVSAECVIDQAHPERAVQQIDAALSHTDLPAEIHVGLLAARGVAEVRLGRNESAEKHLLLALSVAAGARESAKRFTRVYVAKAQYHLGLIAQAAFQSAPIRLPQGRMEKDIDYKAQLLMLARDRYLDAVRAREPFWAVAAGYRVAELFEELFQALVTAPEPQELSSAALEIYRREVRKLSRPLLERALRLHEKNVLLAERLGVVGEWDAKSRQRIVSLEAVLAEPWGP
jgi:tetratricopeptide (TPR) repeat protein